MFCTQKLIDNMMNRNCGTLDISQTWITQLPETLTVRGDLVLNRHIRKLPEKLFVNGDLDLRDTQVDLQATSQLYVGGSLYTGPCTTVFKWCVEVMGDLDLRASKQFNNIDNGILIVGGSLYVDGNNKLIKSIRQSIGIEGDLILRGSCIEHLSHSRMICAKSIDLSYSALKKLPDNLVVYGNLNVSYTSLIEYPKKMVVFGDLDIRGTKLPVRCKGVVVMGDVITDDNIPIEYRRRCKLINENKDSKILLPLKQK